VAQSSGSTYSAGPSILEFDDGYWASVVYEGGYTIISTDIPPICCGSRGGRCYFEVVELGSEEVERISKALGERVERAILICTRIFDRCSGINLKIFMPSEAGRAVEAFKRAREDVFRALAEIYGPGGR